MSALPAIDGTGRLVAVRVGLPAPMDGDSERMTAFLKTAVDGLVWLGSANLEGDRQADLTVHGGPDKAVCVYPASHYERWARELPSDLGGPGWFGENFTVSDQTEASVCIGDVYRVGTAIVQVSQPRGPCWKLAARWRRPDLPKRVVATGRSGWYLRVLEEGDVSSGCPLWLESRPWPQWPIAEVNRLTYARSGEAVDDDARRALADCPALAAQWRAALVDG